MTVEKRMFGRTGHESSAVIFGAAALKECDQGVADRALDVLFEYGVNHIDVAPRYGEAELRVGAWMPAHRKDFLDGEFKLSGRTYRIMNELPTLLMIVIVFSVILRF